MSRTDNTMPWKLIDEEMEAEYGRHRWFVMLNCRSPRNRQGNLSLKQRERRRWWHGERQRVKNDLRRGIEPLSSLPRHGVLWDLW